jgi:N-sulfoglucosamine sulfohydrolase
MSKHIFFNTKRISQFVLLCFLSLPHLSRASEAKLNFLLIVADDLTWSDLGYEGSPDIKTPNLDKLRSQSMHLTRMFSPATTCSPTRHALYTGLYPIRSGAYPNHTRVYDGTKSLFTYLKAVGYRVALQNKSHVGPKDSFPFEYIKGADDLTKTTSFLTRDAAQPWFMVFASSDPHGPNNRGPKYDATKIKVPSYLHDNTTTRSKLAKYFGEISKLDEQVGALMKMLEDTKQAENTIVLFVSEQGSSFPYGGKWSVYDNGIRASALLRWPGKVKAGSSSAALMQYVDVAPTFLAAVGIDHMKIDVGCPDAHGATGFDGRSFLPVLLGETDTFRNYIFAQHTTAGIIGAIGPYPIRAVRDSRYKFIRNLTPELTYTIKGIHKSEVIKSWQADAKGFPALTSRIAHLFNRPSEELYDLQSDPDEMKNLAADPALAEIKAKLQKELEVWMIQQKDHGLETEKLANAHKIRKK